MARSTARLIPTRCVGAHDPADDRRRLVEAIPGRRSARKPIPTIGTSDGISGRTTGLAVGEETVALGGSAGRLGAVDRQQAPTPSPATWASRTRCPNPSGDCTEAKPECLNAPNGKTSATADSRCSPKSWIVVFYSQNLAVPPRRNFNDRRSLGQALFYARGCRACHAPSSHRRGDGPTAAQSQKIWPYSDLLLHDIGEGLADSRPEGVPTGNEWRTPPLWGIGLTKLVSGHTLFLHDGRARNLDRSDPVARREAQAARDGMRPCRRKSATRSTPSSTRSDRYLLSLPLPGRGTMGKSKRRPS